MATIVWFEDDKPIFIMILDSDEWNGHYKSYTIIFIEKASSHIFVYCWPMDRIISKFTYYSRYYWMFR